MFKFYKAVRADRNETKSNAVEAYGLLIHYTLRYIFTFGKNTQDERGIKFIVSTFSSTSPRASRKATPGFAGRTDFILF